MKNIGQGDKSDFENPLFRRPNSIKSFFLKIWTFELLYFLKKGPIFAGSVHNLGRSDGDII